MGHSEQQLADFTKKVFEQFVVLKEFKSDLELEMVSAKDLLQRLVGFLSCAQQFIQKYHEFLETHVKPVLDENGHGDGLYFYNTYSKYMQKPALTSHLEKLQQNYSSVLENDKLLDFSLEQLKRSIDTLRMAVINYDPPLQNQSDTAFSEVFSAMQKELGKFYTSLYQTMAKAEHNIEKIKQHQIPFEISPKSYYLAQAAKMQKQDDSCFRSIVTCFKQTFS